MNTALNAEALWNPRMIRGFSVDNKPPLRWLCFCVLFGIDQDRVDEFEQFYVAGVSICSFFVV